MATSDTDLIRNQFVQAESRAIRAEVGRIMQGQPPIDSESAAYRDALAIKAEVDADLRPRRSWDSDADDGAEDDAEEEAPATQLRRR